MRLRGDGQSRRLEKIVAVLGSHGASHFRCHQQLRRLTEAVIERVAGARSLEELEPILNTAGTQ